MNLLLFHIPLIAAGVVVGGVVIASGGSGLRSGVAAIATGASGFATSALLIQSQSSKQETSCINPKTNDRNNNGRDFQLIIY